MTTDTLKQAAQALRRAKDAHEFAEMKQPGYGHAEDAKLCAELAAALEALAAQEPAAWRSPEQYSPDVGSWFEYYDKYRAINDTAGLTPLYPAPIATPDHDSKVRNAALEEAAQVCEAYSQRRMTYFGEEALEAEVCAEHIRALKGTRNED